MKRNGNSVTVRLVRCHSDVHDVYREPNGRLHESRETITPIALRAGVRPSVGSEPADHGPRNNPGRRGPPLSGEHALSQSFASLQTVVPVQQQVEKLARRFGDAATLGQSLSLLALDHLRRIVDFHGKGMRAHAEARRALWSQPRTPVELFTAWSDYVCDASQRAILTLDILREVGNGAVAREQTRDEAQPVLLYDYAIGTGRPNVAAAGKLSAGADSAGTRNDRRSDEASLYDHRPARWPRPRHRRLQVRQPGWRGTHPRPSGVFRDLSRTARTGPDPGRRHRRRRPLRARDSHPSCQCSNAGRYLATVRAVGPQCCWPHRTRM